MKKLLSILLSGIILFCSMSYGMTFLLFKLNQTEIAKTLCINKDRPEKACHGKCFLKDRLEENHNEQDPAAPWTNTEESLKINLISSEHLLAEQNVSELQADPLFPDNSFHAQLFVKSIFRPPTTFPSHS